MACYPRFSVARLALCSLLGLAGCSDLVARNIHDDPPPSGTSDESDLPGDTDLAEIREVLEALD
jgi:hypothetical protein